MYYVHCGRLDCRLAKNRTVKRNQLKKEATGAVAAVASRSTNQSLNTLRTLYRNAKKEQHHTTNDTRYKITQEKRTVLVRSDIFENFEEPICQNMIQFFCRLMFRWNHILFI